MSDLAAQLACYVVTAEGGDHAVLARAAVAGGAGCVQLRAPELAREALVPLARDIDALCAEAGVAFVVNDDLEAALACPHAGVHLGQTDLAVLGHRLESVRERLGPERLLGVSAETQRQAVDAQHDGADYLGVTVWATATKRDASPHGLDGLRAIAAATDLPVVAIGGIDADNAAAVLAAGATGVAVVTAVSRAADPVAATRRLCAVVRAATGRATDDRS